MSNNKTEEEKEVIEEIKSIEELETVTLDKVSYVEGEVCESLVLNHYTVTVEIEVLNNECNNLIRELDERE